MLSKKLQSLNSVKFVLFLLVIFFTGQTIATEHAIEHGFEDDADICFLCDISDSYQNSLSTSEIPECALSCAEEVLVPYPGLIISFAFKNNQARDPPSPINF